MSRGVCVRVNPDRVEALGLLLMQAAAGGGYSLSEIVVTMTAVSDFFAACGYRVGVESDCLVCSPKLV
jgi:UDP-N-acetylglucosamine enolpyruvyl transferase